jgi:ribonuclease D
MTTSFVTTHQDLVQLCAQLTGSPFIAVDTEFVRERTYYPQLALIQVTNGDVIACIDPLAIDDLTPLKTLFADRRTTKVFHAASQDMEVFYHLFGELPTPSYDTQIAATLQGLGDQIGYAALVQEMLGVELDKSHSRTDWLQRPLSDKQISYAEDDVRYLAKLYPMQREQLAELGRLEWLDDDFNLMGDPNRYRPNPATAWLRIKGLNKLRGVQLAILEKLGIWREERAMEKDQPRRRIAADETLLDIAKLRPKSLQALGKLRDIPESLVNKQGEALLKCVTDAEALPREAWPKLHLPERLSSAQDALVDALQAIMKLSAHQHQISITTLTSRKELEDLVRGERELSILQGWRRHHGGELLLEFLEGKSQLVATASGLALNR